MTPGSPGLKLGMPGEIANFLQQKAAQFPAIGICDVSNVSVRHNAVEEVVAWPVIASGALVANQPPQASIVDGEAGLVACQLQTLLRWRRKTLPYNNLRVSTTATGCQQCGRHQDEAEPS